LCEAFAAQEIKEYLRMTPTHVGVSLAFGWLIAVVSPSIDHLLGRASADAELQAPAGDEIGCACVLGGKARQAVARSDERENKRRPRPTPRLRRQGRWIARAYLRPSGSATATRRSSARMRGIRSSSYGQSIDARGGLRPERRRSQY